MSWKGTLLLLILAALATCILLLSGKSHTRSARESLINMDPALVRSIIIREGSGSLILKKQNGVWAIDSKPSDQANAEIVRAILQSVTGMKPLDTLPPAELKGGLSPEALDLKNPRRSLTIEGNTTETINFGVEGATPARLYARLGSTGAVYLISSEIAGLAFRPLQDFRDPHLTQLSPDHLEEITFSKGNNFQQLILKKDRQGWKLVSPLATPGDQQAISAWAGSLLSTKIERWMPAGTDPASCGLESPSGIFTVREEGGSAAVTIMIGSEVPGSPQCRYARCSNRPEICVINGMGAFLDVTPLTLRSKKLQHIEYDAIDRMEIRPSDGLLPPRILSRKKGSEDWELSNAQGSANKSTLPGPIVRAWFEKLQEITAKGFEAATPDHLKTRGLTQPAVIRLLAHLSENTAEEKAGDMVLADYAFGTPSTGIVALRVGDAPDLLLVPESALELTRGPETPEPQTP